MPTEPSIPGLSSFGGRSPMTMTFGHRCGLLRRSGRQQSTVADAVGDCGLSVQYTGLAFRGCHVTIAPTAHAAAVALPRFGS